MSTQKKIFQFKALRLMEVGAPLFFILAASLRCFLETRIFSTFDDFSYYTLFHHVLWYVTAISSVLVFLSLYLKVTPRKLLWLYWGGVIIFIPVFHSMVTHTPMNLEYFAGSFSDILRYSLSAGWEYERNRSQFFAIITLDIGVFIIGYAYSRSLKRALGALAGVHLILTLVGTKWFSDQDGPQTLIFIRSAFTGHVFMALIWLQAASFLTIALVGIEKRAGLAENHPGPHLAIAVAAWMLVAGILYVTGIFNKGFDAITASSPVWAGILLFYGFSKKKEDLYPSPFFATILAVILVVQLLVTVPLYFPGNATLNPRKIVQPLFYSN